MIAKEKALSFEEEIKLKLYDFENTHTFRTLQAYDIFKQIVNSALIDEKSYFSGLHAKLLYLFNKLNLTQELIDKINSYRKYINKLITTPTLYCSKEDMESSFRIALAILEITSNGILDNDLKKFLSEEPILTYVHSTDVELNSFKLVVTAKSKPGSEHRIIFGESVEQGKVAIYLNKTWESLWKYIRNYSEINVVEVEKNHQKNGYNVFYCNPNTFLVYESDYLIDVTEIASCFQNNGQSEYFALLNWLSVSYPSTPMMIGNIVNNLFDAIISDEEVDTNLFIENELSKSPLQNIFLNKFDKQSIGNINNDVELIFQKLKRTIIDIPNGETFIEPSFISPKFGLQGRLDAMVVDSKDDNKKEVIELKSGGFPSKNVPVKTGNDIEYSLSTWRNHYVQASCYNLILKSVYPERYGNSSIYYAKDDKKPFRNAPILSGNFQEIIDLRNRIVGLYFDIANRNFSSIANLVDELGKFPPSYWQKDVDSFINKLNNSSSLAHEYLKEMLSFVFRELISNKVGKYSANPERAYSNLWLEERKSNSRNTLHSLQLNQDESNFDNYHLRFDRYDSSDLNFRNGDQIVIYPTTEDGITLLLKEQLLKGVIKQIDKSHVLISLRNKLLGKKFLEKYSNWAIESDFLEHSFKKLPSVLFDFIDDENFEIKVGKIEQKIDQIDYSCNYLNEMQSQIVKAAISTKNYYLIQGPPGTGKTSFVLRAILEYYYNNSDNSILLTAYTNRAVDQICTVLKEKTNIDFIRLGSKESSEHGDVLLSNLSTDYSIAELKDKFESTRVVVSTVSSLLSHQELFKLKKFGIAVVDEAAQILEPFVIKIINYAQKYIMIGDEKQLPAIVTQAESNHQIENDLLSTIEMTNISESYFERMLRNAKKNGWDNSYGMLTHQGRMGQKIMELANNLFYQGKLLNIASESKAIEILEFQNVEPENVPYLNNAEADYIVKKIENLIENNETNEFEIGVISPFRSQCALIRNKLPFEIRDKVAVDTVERFQGSERDIIFISFAVNKPHHIVNMSSPIIIDDIEIDRKLNVAITRAKQRLYVTGCREILVQSPIYKKFIDLLVKEN
ncbi:MAG: AAA family ATPase [Ignavibacteriae bacterium]|nr:AAA family ATPase [Ignavibacteriota bacterium]MCB9221037.1 AAA family ATPase [Ignavibacteria bacterium]